MASTLTRENVRMNPKKQCQNTMTYQGTSDIIRFVRFAVETSQAIKIDKNTPYIVVSPSSSASGDFANATNITPQKAITMLTYSNLMIFSFKKMTAKMELQNGFVYHTTICKVSGINVTI